jgi:hypothetical protein
MGLWLKCPQCQTANPLDLKSCAKCNASLENLPAAQRVYFLGQAAPAPLPEAAPPAAAPPPAAEAPAAATPAGSPPKRAKGSKSRKKKS